MVCVALTMPCYLYKKDSFAPVSVQEMDAVSDELWVRMAENPALGLTCMIEIMRDREGFYSVEVLNEILKRKGYCLVQIDHRTLQGLPGKDIGVLVVENISQECGFVALIVREKNHEHWLTMTVDDGEIIVRNSNANAPIIIDFYGLGRLIKENSLLPGSVYFIKKNGDTTSSKQANVTGFEKESQVGDKR